MSLHPLLKRLNIEQAHYAVLEDLSETIQHTQLEAERMALEASGKGPAIPFLPCRAVEDHLALKAYNTWCLSNINLLAPITVAMWKMWVNLSDSEVKVAEERALHRWNLMKEPFMIPHAFPLAMFDHHKCTSTQVLVLVKQDVLTVNPRIKKYTSIFWNCQCP
jgi:hypothetical protein